MEISIANEDQMKVWARRFTKTIKPNTLILLEGDLGVGKTFLVSQILQALGNSEACSPTYSLHNSYVCDDILVEHFDLYRLESVADLEAAGFFDIMSETNTIIFVEWADRLPNKVLPFGKEIIRIAIHLDGEIRKLNIEEL